MPYNLNTPSVNVDTMNDVAGSQYNTNENRGANSGNTTYNRGGIIHSDHSTGARNRNTYSTSNSVDHSSRPTYNYSGDTHNLGPASGANIQGDFNNGVQPEHYRAPHQQQAPYGMGQSQPQAHYGMGQSQPQAHYGAYPGSPQPYSPPPQNVGGMPYRGNNYPTHHYQQQSFARMPYPTPDQANTAGPPYSPPPSYNPPMYAPNTHSPPIHASPMPMQNPTNFHVPDPTHFQNYQTDEERFASQLQALRGMGFTNTQRNIEILIEVQGSLGAAVEKLWGERSKGSS